MDGQVDHGGAGIPPLCALPAPEIWAGARGRCIKNAALDIDCHWRPNIAGADLVAQRFRG
jgi:hypothetical protein